MTLGAWRSADQDGEIPAAQALQLLARSPPWGWGAMAPVCERILGGDVGERPRAMVQRLGLPITRGRSGLGPAVAPRERA